MAFTLFRDVAIILLSGFFAWFGLPVLIGTPPEAAFFLTGIVVALPVATLYAMGVMVANKVPQRALHVAALLAFAAAVWPLWPGAFGSLLDLFPIVPPLLFVLVWAWRSKHGFTPVLFRGLWLYGFTMVGLQYGLMTLLAKQPYVQPIAFLTAIFYLNLRLASELMDP